MLAAWVAAGSARPAAAPAQAGEPAPCLECQVLGIAPGQAAALPAALPGLTMGLRVAPGASAAGAVTDLRRRGARVALHLLEMPSEADPLLALEVDIFVFEIRGVAGTGAGDPDQRAFDLKRVLSAARGRQPAATLFVAAPAAVVESLDARGVSPYVDGFVAPSSSLTSAGDLLAPLSGDATVVRRLPDGPEAAAIAGAAAAARDWFPRGLIAAAGRPLQCGADRALPAFLNPRTLDLVAVTGGCPADAVVTGDLAGVTADRIEVGTMTAFRLAAGAGGDRFAEGVTVGAARALTIEEIVARHQAAAARQWTAVRSEIAAGAFTLAFDAPGFVAPVTITAAATIFRDAGGTDIRHADVRVNGVRFTAKDGVPRLPIIEPERVAVAPLVITLTGVYRYTLEGREMVDGRPCYVVAFAPRRAGASLFRGRAWIDQQTFAMARVSAAQTGLTGPIVASEQTDVFAPDAKGRWLLTRSEISQTYEGASIRTPIHRLLVLDRHEVNPPDFAARRAEAYASHDVILRDTPDGFRYLKRVAGAGERVAGGGERVAGGGERVAESGDARRLIAPPVTRIRTLAMGVIVDPNITTPLPFAGLSYVDFDLFGSGTQFSGFFGGSFAQAAFSAPSVGGSRWQLAGRAFAIATSYNDRAFVDGREIYAHDIRQRPAQVAVWALRPIAPRAAIRVGYDWDYNRFDRGEVTDPAFVVPRDQNAHGIRAGVDLQYSGWQASVWASHTIRIGWQHWGMPGSTADTDVRSSFQRFGASALRTASVSPRLTTRVDASIVGGRHLDRFSRISFGTFDNRLHGYPSALIRYDSGAVLRTALSWTAATPVRIDGFVDGAVVRDPGFGRGLRGYAGFGAALECPAPFGTLLAAEWGYGPQGVNTDGRRGTHVVRITGYKVF